MNIAGDLTRAPIPGLIRKIAVPASIGFLFNTLYNVIDTYWAGCAVSQDALTALGLSFPLFFIIIAFSHGANTGPTALISQAVGRGDRREAHRLTAQAIVFALLVSVVVMALGLGFAPTLFRMLKAEGRVYDYAMEYSTVIFLGAPCFGLSTVLNAPLAARGDMVGFLIVLVCGCLINAILDPVFVNGWFGVPAFGFRGLAVSTVSIQVVGTAYMLFRAASKGYVSRRTFVLMRPNGKLLGQIAMQSLPATFNMLTVAIGIFVTTRFVADFGDTALAGFNVATRIEQIALLPSIGLNIAALAICGQNFGARRFDRIRETVRTAMAYGIGLMLLAAAPLIFFAEPMLHRFGGGEVSAELVSVGRGYLRVMAFLLPAYVILYISTAALQGMKKPMYAIWIGLVRQILLPLGLCHLFANILDHGLPGVWWGQFTSNWAAAVFTLFFARHLILRTERDIMASEAAASPRNTDVPVTGTPAT